jgi:membrane fusion protein, heavy metal efflux system
MIHARSILTSFAAVILLAGCAGKDGAEENAAQAAGGADSLITVSKRTAEDVGLAICVVAERPLAGVYLAPARLIADQDLVAHVGSLLPGRVHSVAARIGERVRRGQVLMRIEGLEIGTVKADYIKSRAQLKYADETLKRQRSLSDQNVGSKKSLLEAQAEYDKALASFNAEDKKIHAIGLSDDDVGEMMKATPEESASHVSSTLSIRAPIDGVVVERNVVIGQLVDQSTNAFRIVNTSTLYADAEVHEKDIALLPAKVEVRLTFPAWPGESFSGRITYIGEVLDERTRMVKVRAVLPNPHGRLKPEMFGEMRIPLAARSAGPVIPLSALFDDNGKRCVFVATSDTTFIRRVVHPGPATADSVLISSGLRAGERVVVNGAFLLQSELRKDLMGGE